jgi:hypothetical protein
MGNSVSIQPMATGNALGGFSVQPDGYVQGVALDDPAIRNSLAIGYLKSDETEPMWGGLPIFEDIPVSTSNGALGGAVGRATDYPDITGISVFNQANAFISTPQSQVPTASANQTVPFYRMGSGARIALPIDPALVSLDGGLITQQVSWDFVNNRIKAFDTTAFPCKILLVAIGNSKIVSYDSVNNLANWDNAGSVAIVQI